MSNRSTGLSKSKLMSFAQCPHARRPTMPFAFFTLVDQRHAEHRELRKCPRYGYYRGKRGGMMRTMKRSITLGLAAIGMLGLVSAIAAEIPTAKPEREGMLSLIHI